MLWKWPRKDQESQGPRPLSLRPVPVFWLLLFLRILFISLTTILYFPTTCHSSSSETQEPGNVSKCHLNSDPHLQHRHRTRGAPSRKAMPGKGRQSDSVRPSLCVPALLGLWTSIRPEYINFRASCGQTWCCTCSPNEGFDVDLAGCIGSLPLIMGSQWQIAPHQTPFHLQVVLRHDCRGKYLGRLYAFRPNEKQVNESYFVAFAMRKWLAQRKEIYILQTLWIFWTPVVYIRAEG